MDTVIHIGTSGWSYDDWKGLFYPPDLPGNRYLDFYARHFSVAEVNSTYYHPPARKMVEGLIRRTGGQMTFCLKAHRSMTHQRDADDALYRAFSQAVHPLQEAGLLGAVLAQFPQSLKPDREGRTAVETIRRGLADLPLAFEFRDRTWDDGRVYAWMRANDVALCCVDVPAIESLFPPVVRTTTDGLAYLRCHGRNAGSWYEHEHAWQRYDYLYSEEEIRQVAQSVRKLGQEARQVFVFYNNHYQARAVDGARKLLEALDD